MNVLMGRPNRASGVIDSERDRRNSWQFLTGLATRRVVKGHYETYAAEEVADEDDEDSPRDIATSV